MVIQYIILEVTTHGTKVQSYLHHRECMNTSYNAFSIIDYICMYMMKVLLKQILRAKISRDSAMMMTRASRCTYM